MCLFLGTILTEKKIVLLHFPVVALYTLFFLAHLAAFIILLVSRRFKSERSIVFRLFRTRNIPYSFLSEKNIIYFRTMWIWNLVYDRKEKSASVLFCDNSTEGRLKTTVYVKCDDENCRIVNFPFLSSYISQF